MNVASAVAVADRSAAVARALGSTPLIRRGETLTTIGGAPPVTAAHVATADLTAADTSAGAADAVGTRLRYSDPGVHARLMPAPEIARVIFELAEQLRCESLVPATLPGVRRNLDHLFWHWIDTAWQTGAIETELGLHLLTVAVVLRSRLTATSIPDDLADTIESTRFALAETLGKPLRELRRRSADQAAFAEIAREMALAVAARFPQAATDARSIARLRASGFVPVPPQASNSEDLSRSTASAEAASTAIRREYAVFTKAYDRVTDAEGLGRPEQLQRWARALDETPRPFPPSRISRIAAARLATPTRGGWTSGTDEGVLDPARLGQFIARQDPTGIFRLPSERSRPDAALTILLDCSGSMRRHSNVIAALCDLLGRGLEIAGVETTVLGFSTVDWHGGRSVQDWRRAGSPSSPGRLGGTHHLIFASGTSWRTARRGLPALLRPDLYAEGVDGEALEWAAEIAAGADARRRILLTISDGGPMSTATREAQGAAYLDRHLAAVADSIERAGAIQLRALGIDADLSAFYRRSHTVALGEVLDREVVSAALDLITEE